MLVCSNNYDKIMIQSSAFYPLNYGKENSRILALKLQINMKTMCACVYLIDQHCALQTQFDCYQSTE